MNTVRGETPISPAIEQARASYYYYYYYYYYY